MKEFLNKRNIINLLLLGIMVLAIPLTVKLARQQQILFSRAAEARIEFLTKEHGGTTVPNDPNNPSCVITRNNNKVTLCKDVKVRLVAPTGTDIKFQQAQSRTSLLPQEGLVSTVYAGHTCPDVTTYCWEGDIWQDECDPEDHSVNTDCEGTCIDVDGVATCVGGTPYSQSSYDAYSQSSYDSYSQSTYDGYSQSSYDNYSQSSYDTYSQSSYSGGTTGSQKGQLCEAGYNQIFEDGTTRHCTPGEYSDDQGTPELCKYDGDGDDAGPEDTKCDKIVSCPAGKALVGNECHSADAIPVLPGTGTTACFLNGGNVDPDSADQACKDNHPGSQGKCDPNEVGPYGDGCVGPAGGSGTPANTCKSDPVTPPSGYKWTADCSKSCNTNDDCSKGVNNQDGWCYGFAEGNRCLKLEAAGQGSPGEGSCKDNPVAPPAGYKWTADCNRSCTNNSQCPKGANNQDGWCYGFANNINRCLKLESVGGATGDGVCRDNPVTPPSGYKWTADCNRSCTNNSQCPKGANNQDGWCYGFANNINRCLKLESVPSEGQKCFVCRPIGGQNKWVYPGANADGTGGNPNDNSCSNVACTPSRTGTCKGPDDKLNTACGGSAAPTITKYRVAQQANELESAQFKPYPGGAAGVIEDISFSDTTPGQNKCVFVQFKDSAENITERKNECITYVGPDPVISGASCNLDITDGSLKFQATGDNFGARDLTNSHLAADNSNLEIREWTNQRVVARMVSPPDTTTGKTYVVTLTRADGTKGTASCSVNTTQISLGAKLFCRAPSSFDQDNVNLLIVQNALGVGATGSVGVGTTVPSGGNFKAGDKVRETVTITKEGVISNLKTKLQEGIEYIVCVKAPKSLRLCTNKFTAVAGNNIITHRFDLPVGDVNDDEAINSADASICKAEWGPARAGRAKACEFNRDNVTNSFEWSCLLHDFNKPNQPEPL